MVIKDLPCWAKASAAVLLVVFLFNLPSGSGEVAAWVQAFGSIMAVASGFLLVRRQLIHRDQAEIKREMVRRSRLIKSLKTEVSVNWTMLNQSWGDCIRQNEASDTGVNLHLNARNWIFPVFESSASDLSLIEEEATRNLIIKTYAAARGFLLTMEINNELIARVSDAQRSHLSNQTEDSKNALATATQNFNGYGQHIRGKFSILESLVSEVSLLRDE